MQEQTYKKAIPKIFLVAFEVTPLFPLKANAIKQ